MRISVVSTSDNDGGAAKAAYRLFRALSGANADVGMSVLEKSSSDPGVDALIPAIGGIASLRRMFRKLAIRGRYARYRFSRPPGVDIFNSADTPFDQEMAAIASNADVVNLHWIARFIDWRRFFGAIGEQKVVWTLHDQNSFTGGCHYTMGCRRFMIGCGRCPQLGSTEDNDLSARIFQNKVSILKDFDKSRLHLVAPSHWLAREAGRSPIFAGVARSAIPNSVDVERYRPVDGRAFRDRHEIGNDQFVMLFIAHNLNGERKGGDLLAGAMSHLEKGIRDQVVVVTVGKGDFKATKDIRQIALGEMTDDEAIVEAYSAADVLALPSREDNLPNTMLEAMACETPVVGFPVGGIPDFVIDGESGFLASEIAAEALASATARAYASRAQLGEMGVRCRNLVLKECTEAVQSRRYLEVFTHR